MPLQTGVRLGPYEIVSPLGAGGMGEVYRARDARLGREVAVKVLPDGLARDPEALARFEQEARAVAALSHPNILAIHDFGREGGSLYAVVELLEGATLRERLSTADVGLPRAIDWAIQIAMGLAAAHERGVIHRDLKPENVFVTRDGVVKILDFGLARRDGAAGGLAGPDAPTAARTTPGTVLGTAGYLSPEQARGEAADNRSDLFAFGAVLYELVAGRRAFQRDTTVETMVAVLREEPPPLSESGRAVPREIEEIIRHCLEKSPEERFRSAPDLVFALRMAEHAVSRPSASDPGTPAAARTGSDPGRAVEPSIAVLPFRSLSPGTDGDYFGDGMTEEIIGALAEVPGLRVAARTSSFAFRGRDEDVRRIGRELSVATVLEGSVRQAGQRLRVAAQLVDVATGYHLWAQRWDRELADVFAVQDEIARAIASTLQPRLTGAVAGKELVAKRTSDVVAYDRYLKGRYFWNQRRLQEAIVEFEAAIERDPGIAEAHTALSTAWAVWGFYGGIPTWEAWARGRAAAERAETIAPESAAVPLAFGVLEHYYGWNTTREEQFCRLAVERNPKSGDAHFWLCLCLGATGKAEEALAAGREGARLEPHSGNMRAVAAWPFLFRDRYEEAEAEAAAALAIEDAAPFALWTRGCTLYGLGRFEEAIPPFRRAVEATGDRYSFYTAMLGGALGGSGRRAEAEEGLAALDARAAREYVPPFDRAVVLAGLGRDGEALDALEKAYAERNALLWARLDFPQFRRLRRHPRFEALVRKIAATAFSRPADIVEAAGPREGTA